MATTKGSNPNDEMKYVRNNLYGYGFQETTYIAPTKTLNDIEIDLDVINDINEVQSADIFILKAQVESILASYLSREDGNELFGVSLNYDSLTGELSLVNGDGELIGSAVIVVGGGGGASTFVVNSIELVDEDDQGNEGLFLEFTYTVGNASGTTETRKVYSDFGSLKTLFTAGDGVEIDADGKISLKLNGGTNDYIEIGPDGISTSGLSTAITEIEEKVSHIDKGEGLVTTNEGEAAFGNYNVSTSGETLFSIGNGTDDEHRSNAFEVKADGSVWMNVEGEYLNINDLLSMIAHETYN